MPVINLDDEMVVDLDAPFARVRSGSSSTAAAPRASLLRRVGRAVSGELLGTDPIPEGGVDPAVQPGIGMGGSMAVGAVADQVNEWLRSRQSQGNQALGEKIAAVIPVAGPAIARMGRDLKEGDLAGAATRGLINFAPVGAAKTGVKAALRRGAAVEARAAMSAEAALRRELAESYANLVSAKTGIPVEQLARQPLEARAGRALRPDPAALDLTAEGASIDIKPPRPPETMYEGPTQRPRQAAAQGEGPFGPGEPVNVTAPGTVVNLDEPPTQTMFGGTQAVEPGRRVWWNEKYEQRYQAAKENVEFLERNPDFAESDMGKQEGPRYRQELARMEQARQAAEGTGPVAEWRDQSWTFHGPAVRFYDKYTQTDLMDLRKALDSPSVPDNVPLNSQPFFGSDALPLTKRQLLAEIDSRLERPAGGRTIEVSATPDTRTGELMSDGVASRGDQEAGFPGRRRARQVEGSRYGGADEGDLYIRNEAGELVINPETGKPILRPEVEAEIGQKPGASTERDVLPSEREARFGHPQRTPSALEAAVDDANRAVSAGVDVSHLPPVPAGHTRLYRREGPASTQGGHWFDTDPNVASSYNDGVGDFKFVDVPTSRLEKANEAMGRDAGVRGEFDFAAAGMEGYSARAQRVPGRRTGTPKQSISQYEPSPRGERRSRLGPEQRPPSEDTFNAPRATPEEIDALHMSISRPGKHFRAPDDVPGPGPAPEGGKFNRNRRSMEEALARVPEVGPELRQSFDDFEATKERLASSALAEFTEAKRSLTSKAEQKAVLRALEGEPPLNERVAAATQKVRAALDRLYQEAKAEGIAERFEDDYLPHFFEGGQARRRKVTTGFKQPSASGIVPTLEKQRTQNAPGYRVEWDVLERAALADARRTAQARHFGPNMEKVRAITKDVDFGSGGLADWVTTAFNRVAEVEPQSAGSKARQKFSGTVRQFQALADLGLSGVMQLGNQAFIMSEIGFKNYAKVLGSVGKDVLTHQGRTDLLVNAIRSGALFPNVSHEVSTALSGKRGFLWGVPTADKAGRIIAQRAGEMMAQFNGGRPLSANEVLKAGKTLSDRTQFRVHVGRLPLWASSPEGRLLTQYASFMSEYTRYVGNLFRKGERQKLARLLAVAAPVTGEIVADVKEALRGRDLWGEDDPAEWEDILRGRRIAPGTPRGAVMRYLQNVATIGGAGMFQVGVERFLDMKKNPLAWAGRVGSTAVEGGEAVGRLAEGDPKGALRFATRTAPAGGFWGPEVNREFLPTKAQKDLGPASTPGWIGKARDAVDPIHEPTGERREDVRRKTKVLEEARRIEKEKLGDVEGLRPEPPYVTADTKIGKSKRNAARLGLEREIREAIAAGDKGKARRLARVAKLRQGFDFDVEEWIRGYEPEEDDE